MTQPDISKMTPAQQVRYAIYCAQQCPQSDAWTRWAERWLSGEDRSEAGAMAAWVAEEAGWAWWAARAAWWAAAARCVKLAPELAVHAAEATTSWAARVAELSGAPLDLAALAQRAAEEEKQ